MAKVKAKAKATPKQPVATKPAARKPAARKPAAKKPAAKKPAATKPAATKPAATKPAATKPAATTLAAKPAKITRPKQPRAQRQPPRAQTEPPRAQIELPFAVGPGPYLRSLRTCIYQVYDLALAKEFYSQALGKDPYFDEPYYVGFDVDGHELGLDPDISKRPPGGSGVIGYWRVDDINAAWQHLTTIGATSIELPHSVGVDLQVSILSDPFGNYIGLIQGA